jgi:hypothetical protein
VRKYSAYYKGQETEVMASEPFEAKKKAGVALGCTLKQQNGIRVRLHDEELPIHGIRGNFYWSK